MSTHSGIFMREKTGNIIGIYCHADGYIEHTGKVLANFYQNPEKVRSLLSLGAISELEISVADSFTEAKIIQEAKSGNWRFGVYDLCGTPELITNGEDFYRIYMGNMVHCTYGVDRYQGVKAEYLDKNSLGAFEFNYLFNEADEKWYVVSRNGDKFAKKELKPTKQDHDKILAESKKETEDLNNVIRAKVDYNHVNDVRSANLYYKYLNINARKLHINREKVRGQDRFIVEFIGGNEIEGFDTLEEAFNFGLGFSQTFSGDYSPKGGFYAI